MYTMKIPFFFAKLKHLKELFVITNDFIYSKKTHFLKLFFLVMLNGHQIFKMDLLNFIELKPWLLNYDAFM